VQTLRPAQEWQPLRLLAYVVMPNHGHLVLWPEHHGDWSEFFRWFTVTHTQRYTLSEAVREDPFAVDRRALHG
jgi:REP element-mobilizing transposase RayT